MKIKVRLFATLREHRGKEVLVDVEESATPLDVLLVLQIASGDVAILLINGRDGALDAPLVPGDVLSVFPPVGGG